VRSDSRRALGCLMPGGAAVQNGMVGGAHGAALGIGILVALNYLLILIEGMH